MSYSYIEIADFVLKEMYFLAISMARLYAFMFFIPIFIFGAIKGKVRNSLVIVVAVIITPLTKEYFDLDNTSLYSTVNILVAELIKGVIIGVMVSIPFWIVESCGGLIDNQRGTLMGGQINSALGQDDFTPLGYLFKNYLGMIIIINFGIYSIIDILMGSYSVWPVNKTLPDLSLYKFEQWLDFFRSYLSIIILFSAPAVVVLMLIDLACGILNILAPQAQVNMIAIPVKCLVGVFILILMLPVYYDLMSEMTNSNAKDVKHFINGSQ